MERQLSQSISYIFFEMHSYVTLNVMCYGYQRLIGCSPFGLGKANTMSAFTSQAFDLSVTLLKTTVHQNYIHNYCRYIISTLEIMVVSHKRPSLTYTDLTRCITLISTAITTLCLLIHTSTICAIYYHIYIRTPSLINNSKFILH